MWEYRFIFINSKFDTMTKIIMIKTLCFQISASVILELEF
jgi:hypothetical protein